MVVAAEGIAGNGADAPKAAADAVECVVVLPTFRRPDHLARTLASLGAQRTRRRFAVIVVENDAEGGEGLVVARRWLAGSAAPPGRAILAAERGNCHAYNAGFAAALSGYPQARFVLAIDDDECAAPDWIENLAATAERFEADCVGGPQVAVFENGETPLDRHPVFTPHYDRTGPVPILFSSGNVAIRRRVLEAMGAPVLDPVFNFTGGGDSDFYARARRRGFRFAWCQEAPVYETTPKRRTEFSWLQARSLRNGALSSILEHRADGSARGRLRTLAKSLALLAAAPGRAVRLGFSTRSAVIGLYPLNVAVGRLLAEFGRINEQYRRPEQN